MSRSRVQPPKGDRPSPVGLSGWLYTDLLLGLAVVFLAMVPVTMGTPEPEPSEEIVSTPTPTPTPTETEATEPQLAACRGLSPEDEIVRVAISADLPDEDLRATFEGMAAEGLQRVGHPADADFGFLIAFGQGPSSQLGAARERARVMSERLRSLLPDRFENAAVRAYWSGGTSTPVVELELFPWIDTCGEPVERPS